MRKALFAAQDAIIIETCEAAEWVRGTESALLDRFGSLVSGQSVVLDFSAVERIDAGGLAVLVSLYRTSRDSGYRFAITNPAARIGEILAVVGLDRVLMVEANEARSDFEVGFAADFERDAA